jgi:hypothetical protein
MTNETKRLTPEAEREIDSRVDLRYSALLGTESHERALLLSEIRHLRQERSTARGAVKELEAKVFSQEQALEVLRTCVARHQRDEADPPGYLQDAVIKAAGLGALHTERDMYRKACDKLRTQLAELERQEPVAWAPSCANAEFAESVRGYGQQLTVWFDRHALEHPGRGHCQTPLYARPVAATRAERDVLAERRRQVEREGMTQSHDDAYLADELPLAACCYCVADEGDAPPAVWPWATKWWKPKDRRSNMVRAAALLLADIERVDRMAQGHKA